MEQETSISAKEARLLSQVYAYLLQQARLRKHMERYGQLEEKEELNSAISPPTDVLRQQPTAIEEQESK